MMRQFLAKHLSELIVFVMIHLIIWGIFSLFSLPMDVYGVLFWLLFIVMAVYLVFKAVIFREESSQKAKVDELENELIQLRNQSESRQDELEEYFIMWVHQIKTPITASQLILKNPDDKAIYNLRQEMLYIENYTGMALNYLKLSNPSTDMVVSKWRLDDIINPLIRKYSIQFIQHNIRLHYETIEESVITEANLTSLMIEQVLNNALKYAKQQEIWIHFDTQTYQLTIKDSGKGIRPEDLPKIFDKGYSGFNGQLNQKSSGLGLYLVQLVAKRLNQAVSVKSTVGEGTEFTVQFHHLP